MKNVLWVIQTNMGESSDVGEWVRAARESGAEVQEVDYTPFSDDLPEIMPWDGAIVLYGAVAFIAKMAENEKYRKGIFADESVFTYENWARNIGSMLLNSPDGVETTTIGDFASSSRDADEDVFVRPQEDTKSFVGAVMKVGEFKEWCSEVKKGSFTGLDSTTKILVGTPYGISAEYRLFVIDGEIVTSSSYKKKGRLVKERGAPDFVMDFGRSVVERWNPAKAFVLDVCVSAGNPYVMEIQSFNSAGQYDCDLSAIARALTASLSQEDRPSRAPG